MPFRVWSGPGGLGVTAPGTAYNGMPFRVLRGAAPQPRSPDGLWCTATGITGIAYKSMSFRVLSGPAAARPRRFSVPAPRDCLQESVL